jgi:hypothetical protein
MKIRKSVGLPSGTGKAVAAGNARTTARALVTVHLAEANHTPMPFAGHRGVGLMRSLSAAALEAEIVRLEAIPEISNGNIRACAR